MTLDEKIALFFKEPTENETGMEHSASHGAPRDSGLFHWRAR